MIRYLLTRARPARLLMFSNRCSSVAAQRKDAHAALRDTAQARRDMPRVNSAKARRLIAAGAATPVSRAMLFCRRYARAATDRQFDAVRARDGFR